jgi:hypothetical protein
LENKSNLSDEKTIVVRDGDPCPNESNNDGYDKDQGCSNIHQDQEPLATRGHGSFARITTRRMKLCGLRQLIANTLTVTLPLSSGASGALKPTGDSSWS